MPTEREERLEEILSNLLRPLRDIPFEVLIRGLFDRRVEPFDKTPAGNAKLLDVLGSAMHEVCLHVQANPIERNRPNEVGNDMEDPVIEQLRRAGLDAIRLKIRKSPVAHANPARPDRWAETAQSQYAREGRRQTSDPGDADGARAHPKRRRANRPAGSVGSICAGSSTRSCPSCAAVARGACRRRAFRRGGRCIGISRRGATAACGCRSTIVRRWRCACPGGGRPTRRPALSTAGLRRRCRAAVRGASTPARRSRAASAISSPLPAGCP